MLVQWSEVPWEHCSTVRFFDLAATKPAARNRDPDYTAGALVAACEGEFYLADMFRMRDRPAVVLAAMWQTYLDDFAALGFAPPYRCEREGGSGGSWSVSAIKRYFAEQWVETYTAWQTDALEADALGEDVLPCPVPDYKPDIGGIGTGGIPKLERIKLVSRAAVAGRWHLVEGPWNDDFLDEVEPYPDPDVHDDQADAVAGAQRFLSRAPVIAGVGIEREDDPLIPASAVEVRPEAAASIRRRPADTGKRSMSFVVK